MPSQQRRRWSWAWTGHWGPRELRGYFLSYLDGIEADGGTIRTGGLGESWTVLPTVVENAPPTARICREEVFGPVVTISAFDTDEEAISVANDTRYGLNAMVFTQNLSRAHRAAAALKAGTVWVNCFFIRDLRAPFGGWETPASAAKAAPSAGSSSPSPRPWSWRSEHARRWLRRGGDAALGGVR